MIKKPHWTKHLNDQFKQNCIQWYHERIVGLMRRLRQHVHVEQDDNQLEVSS